MPGKAEPDAETARSQHPGPVRVNGDAYLLSCRSLF